MARGLGLIDDNDPPPAATPGVQQLTGLLDNGSSPRFKSGDLKPQSRMEIVGNEQKLGDGAVVTTKPPSKSLLGSFDLTGNQSFHLK